MGSDTSSTASGWRVLATDSRGPCNEGSIIPFFEYIIGINGKRLDGVAVSLKEELQANTNKPTELTILNYKTLKTRKITVCPSDDWGGVGLLGLIITYDNFRTADERVVRVLSVYPDSPAMLAGLHPFVDYILGTDSCIFHGIDSFETYISGKVDVDVTLSVYNSQMCQVREVKITPTCGWGEAHSQGILGCEVSAGLLHKVPDVPSETCITVRDTIAPEDKMASNPQENRGEARDHLPVQVNTETNNANTPPELPPSEVVETSAIPPTACVKEDEVAGGLTQPQVEPPVDDNIPQNIAPPDAELHNGDSPPQVAGESGLTPTQVDGESVTAQTPVENQE
jgi:hypothetical protein